MIDLALGVIVAQLNQALRRAFAIREDIAVLANILEQDGRVGPQVENKLVVSLVNIERESVAQRDARPGRNPMARALVSPEPVHLNLSVMFAANFSGSNYTEALKMISGTIGFFRAGRCWTTAIRRSWTAASSAWRSISPTSASAT